MAKRLDCESSDIGSNPIRHPSFKNLFERTVNANEISKSVWIFYDWLWSGTAHVAVCVI